MGMTSGTEWKTHTIRYAPINERAFECCERDSARLGMEKWNVDGAGRGGRVERQRNIGDGKDKRQGETVITD
jgi:hypothetical protein